MAASAPRKTTARKTTTAPRRRPAPKAPVDLGLVLDDDAARAETEALIADREPLFTISGRTYTIPKVVPPSWTLQVFEIAVSGGESDALAFAARKLLEPDAWDALIHCETVSQTAMRAVLKALMDKLLPDGVLVPKA
jgi:hypothetical protein